MKRKNKRLLPALIGAFLLISFIPVISAFASDDQVTVSASDTVSGSEAVAAYEITENVSVNPSWNNGESDHLVWVMFDNPYWNDEDGWGPQFYIPFNNGTQSVTCTVPNVSNPMNSLLYWRDIRSGKIYYPGDTAVIAVSNMVNLVDEDTGSDYRYFFESVWQGDEFLIEGREFNIYCLVDNYSIYTETKTVNGIYNKRTDTTEWDEAYFTLPTSIPTFENYQFIEWNDIEDGSGTSYRPGDRVKVDALPDSQLYAIFEGYTERNIAEVSYYNYISNGDIPSYRINYNDNGVIPVFDVPEAVTNPINRCIGWKSILSERVFEPGKIYYNVNLNDIASPKQDGCFRSITLVPVWEGDELYSDAFLCGVTFLGDGVINYIQYNLPCRYNIKTYKWTFDGDPTITIPNDMVTDDLRNGYTFIGWNTSEYGVGTMYQEGDVLRFNDLNDIFMDTDGYYPKVYPWVNLYATYRTDEGIEVIETGNVNNYVKDVEPVEGLMIRNNVPVSNLTLVVGTLDDAIKSAVIGAMEHVGIPLENATYEAFDLSLIDSTTNTNAVIEAGKIKIFLNYPNVPNAQSLNYQIIHYSNGKVEKVKYEKCADGLVFYADSFSPYVLMWATSGESGGSGNEGGTGGNEGGTGGNEGGTGGNEGGTGGNEGGTGGNEGSNNSTPATGDDFEPGLWLALMSASLLLGIGMITWKKGICAELLQKLK